MVERTHRRLALAAVAALSRAGHPVRGACVLTGISKDRFYRSREEVESYRERDPIVVTGQRLRDLGALSDEQEQEIRNRVKAAINDATDFAEAAPAPDPEEAFMHVYAPEGSRV